MTSLNDNTSRRGLKRPLSDITAAALNTARARSATTTNTRPSLQTQLWRRQATGARVKPSPFTGFSIATDDDDVLRIQSESTPGLHYRPPVPFAVECAKTCSLTAVADEVGCLHIVDHDPDRSDCRWNLLRSSQPHANAIFDLDWSPDDRRIVLGSGDRYCSVVDVQTGQPCGQLRGHQCSVKAVKFRDDTTAITGGRDGMIHLWDLRQADSVASLKSTGLSKVQDTVTDLAFLRDGTIVASGAYSSVVRQWDMRQVGTGTKAMLKRALIAETTTSQPRGITSLCLTSDGTRLLTVCKDSRVYEYLAMRLDAGPQRVWQLPSGSVSTFYCRAAVSDDDVLCVGSEAGTPSFVDVSLGVSASVLPMKSGHAAECTDVAWSHDGSVCVTVGDDAAIRVWRRPK